jgi:hypothetical protein
MKIRKVACLKMIPDIYNYNKSTICEAGLLKFSLRGWGKEKLPGKIR